MKPQPEMTSVKFPRTRHSATSQRGAPSRPEGFGRGVGGRVQPPALGAAWFSYKSLSVGHMCNTLRTQPAADPSRRGTLTWSARCTRRASRRPGLSGRHVAFMPLHMYTVHLADGSGRVIRRSRANCSQHAHLGRSHSHLGRPIGARVPPRSAWDAGEAPWWALAWTLLHGMRCGDSKRHPRWARRSARR